MKNIAIGFLMIVLCAAPSVHAQQSADAPAKNPSEMLLSEIEGTFIPDRTADVPKDFSSWTRGTSDWTFGSTINSSEVDQININFSAEHSNLDFDTNKISFFWKEGVTCGSGAGFVAKKGKGMKTLGGDSLPTGCQLLYNQAYSYDNNQDWQQAYNAGMALVMQCADSNLSFGSVSDAFSLMQQAADGLGNNGSLRSSFYSWLKSVLYLNTTDPEYFCQCVYVMAGEVPIPNHLYPDTGYDWNLAVINWLIQNTPCDSVYLREDFAAGRSSQIHIWSNDTNEYKLDTTLPPLDTIDPGLRAIK